MQLSNRIVFDKHYKYVHRKEQKIINCPYQNCNYQFFKNYAYEEHVKDNWTNREVLESFPNIVKYDTGSKIGVYWLEAKRDTILTLQQLNIL